MDAKTENTTLSLKNSDAAKPLNADGTGASLVQELWGVPADFQARLKAVSELGKNFGSASVLDFIQLYSADLKQGAVGEERREPHPGCVPPESEGHADRPVGEAEKPRSAGELHAEGKASRGRVDAADQRNRVSELSTIRRVPEGSDPQGAPESQPTVSSDGRVEAGADRKPVGGENPQDVKEEIVIEKDKGEKSQDELE